MKKCPTCGMEYPDEVKFCVKCGKPVENVFTPPPVAADPYTPVANVGKNKNGLMIGLIIALSVIIIASVIVIVVVLGKDSSNKDNPITQSQSVVETESQPDNSNSDPDGSGEEDMNQPSQDEDGVSESDDESQDISDYQEYYDSIEETFGRFIMSGVESGQFSAYYDGLGKALTDNDVQACEYNSGKLKELEDSLEESSEKAVIKVVNKLDKLKNKSGAQKALNSSSYVKAETDASAALDSGDYVKAKGKYEKCIKILQKATKKKKKSSGDDFYRSARQDNSTYQMLISRELTNSEVRSLGAEKKRYYVNTLFAAYGYRFSNATIQAFFDNQIWYSPDPTIAVGDQEAVKRLFDITAKNNIKKLSGS